jgi:transmembrane sensor
MNLDDNTREEAAAWFATLRRGPMTVEERQAFDAWRASPVNQAALNHMHELWGEVSAIGKLGVAAPRRAAPRFRAAAAVAGAVVLVGALIGGIAVFQERDTVRTQIGEQRTATLADGSVVALNVVTKVAYRMEDDARNVRLSDGEAAFFVRKDPKRPFKVRAGDYEIRAVGTAFKEGLVTVWALSGPRAGQEIARLPAGRKLSLAAEAGAGAGAGTAADIPVERVAEWRLRVVSYEDVSVETVVADLNRFFDRRLVVTDPALARRRVTLRLQVENRDQTLEVLGGLLGATVAHRGDEDVLAPT